MAEEDNNSNNEPQELNLEEVVEVSPKDLSDEQATFIQENEDKLSDEQKEVFKDTLKKEEEEEEEPEADDVEPETRTRVKEDKDKGDEDDEVDPDDEAAISKVVAKQLKEAGVGDAKDQLEVDAFIRSKPEMGKYRAVALKYMSNPAYSNIPAHNIMAMVSAKDQQKIGAQKEREAAEKAKDTQGGGTTVRKTKAGAIDWSKATQEEIDQKKAEIFDRRL